MTKKKPGTSRVIGQEKQAAQRCGLTHEEWRQRRNAGLRWCYSCKDWHDISNFARDASRKSGIESICLPCRRKRTLRSVYRISADELASLPGADGVCCICKRSGLKLEIDHNHETGKVRGMLCSRCNGGLGLFLDSREMLAKASTYLEDYDG